MSTTEKSKHCYPYEMFLIWDAIKISVDNIFSENNDIEKVKKAVECMLAFERLLMDYKDREFFITAVTVVLCRIQIAVGECHYYGRLQRDQVLHIENLLHQARQYVKKKYA